MLLAAGHWGAPLTPCNGVQGSRQFGDTRRFSAYGLAAQWDPAVPTSVTLNTTRVAAVASLVTGGNDLSQATAGNQPLYTGAPTYYGQPSIRHIAARPDMLSSAYDPNQGNGTLVICTAPGAVVGSDFLAFIDKMNVYQTLAGSWCIYASAAVSSGVTLTPGQQYVLIATNRAANDHDLWTNGSKVVNAGGTAYVDRAGSGVGAGVALSQPANTDFLFGAWFTSPLDQGPAHRVSKALTARMGVAG